MTEENSSPENFKILLLNLGYCTGLNGSIFDYVVKSYRYIFLSRAVEKRIIDKTKKVIERENPDLICFIEINKGRQIDSFVGGKYPFYKVETKYGNESLLRKLPFTKNKSNAVLSKKDLKIERLFLNNGTKKLLYKVFLKEDFQLGLMHFSLSKKVRTKQFEEIESVFSGGKLKVMCGDFNVFDGVKEVHSFLEKMTFKNTSEEPTFPAFSPKKPLDLFLVKEGVKVKLAVLNDQVSDHLPVTLTIC